MLYFDTYKTNSMRSKIYTLLLILSLLLVAQSQNQRRGRKPDETPSNHGILSNIINIVLPGNPNTPILQRLFNKIGFYISALVGSIIGYFMFFRKNKQRNQKINTFMGDWKQKMILGASATQIFDKETADKAMYQINFQKDRKIQVKSANERIQYNISINVKEAEQDSINMYHLKMQGNDPQGKSIFTGFATYKNKKMLLALAQTHLKHQKKEQSPVCYFQGSQTSQQQAIAEGQWWIQGQRGSKGDYSGIWRFHY